MAIERLGHIAYREEGKVERGAAAMEGVAASLAAFVEIARDSAFSLKANEEESESGSSEEERENDGEVRDDALVLAAVARKSAGRSGDEEMGEDGEPANKKQRKE